MAKFTSLTIRILAIASLCTLLVTANTVIAEEIQVPLGQQGDQANTIERPSPGMTKDQVQARFGEPSSFRDAVGEPPISSWGYTGFTVYFEYDRVIHSVLAHRPLDK